MAKIYETLKDLKIPKTNPVIFEIGSHWGEDTLKLLTHFKTKNFYAFEPDPRNIEIFKKRGIDSKVNFYPYAVSDINGNLDFYLSDGYPSNHYDPLDAEFNNKNWSKSSSLKKPKNHLSEHKWCTFNNTVKVEAVMLDTFCADNDIKKIDFLWMDVQGNEDGVFLGAKDILNKTKYIYTEYNNKELYENQKSLDTLIELLDNKFELVFKTVDAHMGGDVLLKNKNVK